MPMSPRRTWLAKHRPTPFRMAVPQSGPMTSRPFSWAISLSSFSCSTVTLSEKSITCMSFFSA